MTPPAVLLTMASEEDSTMAARRRTTWAASLRSLVSSLEKVTIVVALPSAAPLRVLSITVRLPSPLRLAVGESPLEAFANRRGEAFDGGHPGIDPARLQPGHRCLRGPHPSGDGGTGHPPGSALLDQSSHDAPWTKRLCSARTPGSGPWHSHHLRIAVARS